MFNFQNKQIYDNIAMMSPEGFLMCYIGSKRANWYLNRNLARKNSEKEIQLLFKPNGLGHYYDTERNIPVKNHCVVCGCDDISKLSKHHTIPECFRKHFPLRWKSYRSHEVLFLCVCCHVKYELEAQKIKFDMVKSFGGENAFKEDGIIRGHIKTLLKYADCLPPDKKLDLQIAVMIYHNVDDVDEATLKNLLKKQRISPYKLYAESITDHFEFNRFWKQHFIDTMKPNYLPPYWKPDYEPTFGKERVRNILD
jgi:hypothetical protein